MNKEALFAKKLTEVKELARSQGNCIQEAQVIEAFEELDLSSEKLQLVYDYLLQNKIGIGMPLDLEEFLNEEEKNYLSMYLEELAALPKVTDGQKEAYLISAMAGEESAKEKVIELFLPQVVDIAKLYAGQGVFVEDLIGEGNVALTVGVNMLGSQESPVEAEGMLGKVIMDAMEDYISEYADIKKADDKMVAKINKVSEKAHELAEQLMRKVSVEELSEETGISQKTIRDAIRMSGYKMEDIED